MRPTSPPRRGELAARPRAASMRSSTSSGSFVPPRGEELDAVVGRGVVRRRDHHAEVGLEVGDQERERRGRDDAGVVARRRPSSRARPRRRPRGTRPRCAGRGAITAIGRRPDAREPSATRPLPRTTAAAWARPSASSTVRSAFARPRTPSVPNRRGIDGCSRRSRALALRELRSLAGLLETGLLALDDASVTGEEAGLLERRAVVLAVDLVQRARDGEAQRAGLARGATTGDLARSTS